jgi:hypothetical protein
VVKLFIFTMLAVIGGIWVYSKAAKRLAPKGTQYRDPEGSIIFAGPDVDPKSGVYLAPGSGVGSVGFGAERM